MNKLANHQSQPAVNGDREPIAEYIAALEKFYPAAIGSVSVHKRPDNQVIVCVPLPKRVNERMLLFDQMAEVATKLLIETDQMIILSSN